MQVAVLSQAASEPASRARRHSIRCEEYSRSRQLVRRRGLDPLEDRLAMRRLIDEVVLDYDERAMSSTLPPLPDPRAAARAVYNAVAGFGPLQRHLDDPEVEGI